IKSESSGFNNPRVSLCQPEAYRKFFVERARWNHLPSLDGIGHENGFTLIELLVVITIIAILAGLLLPTLAKAKTKAQGIMCMNNMRQLSLAWLQYAHDSNDRIPYASAAGVVGTPSPQTDQYVWVTGLLDFDPSNTSNWDVTQDIQKSPLWPYC